MVEEGGRWNGLAVASVGISSRQGPFTVVGGVNAGPIRVRVDTVRLYLASRMSIGLTIASTDVALRARLVRLNQFSHADYELGAARTVAGIALDAAIGARTYRSARDYLTWHAQGALPVSPWLKLEAGVGATPRSPEGFAEGSYGSVGLRFSAPRPRVVPPSIERSGGGVRIRFSLSDAREVSIAGDWNEWSAVAMTREADGRWSVILPLGAGAHKFTLTVDGRIVVPPGVPRLPDGFGGEVGLIVI